MAEIVKVVVDAMGGDNAPVEPVKGAVEAVMEREDILVILAGQSDVIRKELAKYPNCPKDRIQILNASEIIETAEPPVFAVKKKKDSSIVKGLMAVRNKEADAFVSSGSTGAVLVGGQILVGRSKGVERPPLAPLLPTAKGVSLLIDCGANVDARPSHLVQFAKMGSIYMEDILGIKNPRVAIVNNGAEEEKGNALVKETFPLLKACKDINFIGSIEARDIPSGYADVIVCEAFVGNVILKLYEGVGITLIRKIKEGLVSSLRSKIGALLVKPALKDMLKTFDASEHGGAPLLGLKGLVVKTHGNAVAVEIKNAVFQCVQFKQNGINERIAKQLNQDKEEKAEAEV
ncbi:MAG: phosphate acyltransferase PlsX [Blautia sp.]|nr:phosphate acyltransferase PlsX [Blautia sp.]